MTEPEGSDDHTSQASLTEPKRTKLSRDPIDDEVTVRPPFQVRGARMIYIVGHLPGNSGQELLPPGLEPIEGNVWEIGIFRAADGWGFGGFSAFYAGIAIKGHDSPDGSEGVFLVTGRFSDRAGQIFSTQYNVYLRAGDVSFDLSPTTASGHALLDEGAGDMRLRANPGPENPTWDSGTNIYLGLNQHGAMTRHFVTYSVLTSTAADLDIRFSVPSDHRLYPLTRFQPDYGFYQHDLTLTFGEPVIVDTQPEPGASPAAVLDLLSRLGRAVAIVEVTGRILYLNAQAEALLGPRRSVPLLPPQARVLLTDAAARPTALLSLPSGAQILATAHPIALRLSDAPAAIVLLSDPRRSGPTDPEPLLQLMGLSPSEAALAAIIGQGKSPGEAAALRRITEGTARSMLKTIFQKLDIRRQSELAQIVTRLQQ